jgi:hypothetical protein
MNNLRSFLLLGSFSILGMMLPPISLAQVPAALPPTHLPGLRFTHPFFPGTVYDEAIPTAESLLGFPWAERAANSLEITRCLQAWTRAATNRTHLVEYARSHEQRPLHYVVITAPGNLARLEHIRSDLARLGDPRQVDDAEAQRLTNSLPAVAWLAHTIHGDETEGSDAALALIYHLLAARDPSVHRLLEEVIVIIDPLMNPDGRDRFLKMVAEHRGISPNVDDASLLHTGYWPRGRGNHYLFDLNRDWLVAAHPETRGRIREVARWNPQLFVDAHGMGAQETHLFSPPREPINPNLPAGRAHWGERFAADQARALDALQLVYYTGEWHEEWFPGYSDAWASYRGAIGILYEQARIAEDGVRRPEGRILSYRESVQHHLAGLMANLTTLQTNARALLSHYYQTRKQAVDSDGPYANRTFALPPTANRSRLLDLVRLLELQGIEVRELRQPATVETAHDQLGRELKSLVLPAGTLLIPNRQPLAHLAAAYLEFDPRFSPEVLAEERQDLLLKGASRIYDTTAWNLTMLFGIEAFTLHAPLAADTLPYAAPHPDQPSTAATPDTPLPVGWVIDGADDRSVTAAARLLERGVQVRLADKAFRFDQRDYPRGSLVITPLDNRTFGGDLARALAETATETAVSLDPLRTGLGEGELPDLGGRHFRRLEVPRIALLGREGFDSTDYGALWFALDHHLGIRHSHLTSSGRDWSRYNVIIIPNGGGLDPIVPGLKEWVRAGGTLIASAGATAALTAERTELSRVRQLPEVLGRLADYELTIYREWMGRTRSLPSNEVIWAHRPTPQIKYPWQLIEGSLPEEKELKRRDAWQELFMPQGAMLASRVNTNHWLTVGCGEWLPVLVLRNPILMAADGVTAPVRYGYWTANLVASSTPASASEAEPPPKPSGETKEPAKQEQKKETPRIGWAALPPGAEMHLRMSGLLWPEAAHRLANAAWLTCEPFGRGQIILFASPPTFRSAARGTTRLFLNAVVYGPGCGAAPQIRP